MCVVFVSFYGLMPEINAFTHSLLNLLPVSLAIKKGRLWWLGHVEHKDDAD